MRYLLLLFYIGLAQFSNAQTYRPLLVPGRVWVVGTYHAYEQCLMYGLPPWSDCTLRNRLFLLGDTLIQGISYQKLMRQSFSIGSSWAGPFTLTAPYYYGALREDSSARKVFAYVTTFQNEVLLYDFGLQQGDTCTLRYEAFAGSSSIEAVSVDTVFTLPDGRKKWKLYNGLEQVEGVGMSTGLLYQPPCFEVCDYLACLREQDIPVFNTDNWPFYTFGNMNPYCDYAIVAQQEAPEPGGLQISPNPGSGIFKLEGLNRETTVQVFNVQGKLVRAQTVTDKIDLGEMPSGVYFLKVYTPLGKVFKLVIL